MSNCKIAWCGTNCLGSVGPGFDAKLDIDYFRGWDVELYCSLVCRNKAWPHMATISPADLEYWRENNSRYPLQLSQVWK